MNAWLKVLFLPPFILLTIGFASCQQSYKSKEGLYAEVLTSKGKFVIELYPARAPLTVMNFVGLAEGVLAENTMESASDADVDDVSSVNKHFYDGLVFHRVEEGFVVQTGDPQGTGIGGPGYAIPDEISELKHDRKGTVGMANSGAHTNGSQFYITLTDSEQTSFLDGRYTVFGRVVEGFPVIQKLEINDQMESVKIIRVGSEYESYVVTKEAFEEHKTASMQAIKDSIQAEIESTWPQAVMDAQGNYRYIIKPGNGVLVDAEKPIKLAVAQKFITGSPFTPELEEQGDQEIQIENLEAEPFLPFLKELILGMQVGSRMVVIFGEEFVRRSQGMVVEGELALNYIKLEMEILENT